MPAAAFKLADAYRKGSLAEGDIAAAIKWYTHAGKSGVVEAYFALGNMYSRGEGTSDGNPDYKAAFDMFEIAATRGNVESQYNMGHYYLEGKGVEKDPHLAAEYWGMAAAKRFPIALLNLGKLYAEGKELPQNIRRGKDLLNVAIECSGPDGFIKSQAQSLLDRIEKQQRDTWCVIL
ncbi:HCP-like protein [Coemansia reversa NRRL 1564]|uniref:HCP-like protein n=1 Tax=Coemansia reversa (strain ATCC 12441 / NRRL 1564) TaxID=763665 RepID=A0A2G5B862_COERN|nr:HCP-like protein [Coemansia reversa NRRL 1564]|eukprot:PIA15189.1 HCP-like protein [Coemansia reversa NRRL 1564]